MHDAETVSVRLVTDPPVRIESPAQSAPRLAIHLGGSVYMISQRGGQKHRGLAVHGDIEIVPAETPCVWEASETGTWLVVSIEPSVLRNAAQELNLNANRLELLNRCQMRDPQIEHICWALKAEMEAGYPNGRVFLNSLSTALAAALVCRHSSLAAPPFASSTKMSGHRLREALSYIEDNLKQDLSLNDIAQAAGVSVSHLKAAFRQLTGTPVHQYVIRRRLERAASLLSQGGLLISEVAEETGFAHQSHLAKHMRRILGCSPKAIRRG